MEWTSRMPTVPSTVAVQLWIPDTLGWTFSAIYSEIFFHLTWITTVCPRVLGRRSKSTVFLWDLPSLANIPAALEPHQCRQAHLQASQTARTLTQDPLVSSGAVRTRRTILCHHTAAIQHLGVELKVFRHRGGGRDLALNGNLTDSRRRRAEQSRRQRRLPRRKQRAKRFNVRDVWLPTPEKDGEWTVWTLPLIDFVKWCLPWAMIDSCQNTRLYRWLRVTSTL